jgi:hypothetical protein
LLGESKRAEEDRHQANGHRERIYERIDELREEMDKRFARTDESIAISGSIAAQARDQAAQARERAAEVKKLVDEEIKPQTDDYRRMRTMGNGFMIAVALAAGTLGITFSSVVKAFLAGVTNSLTGRG